METQLCSKQDNQRCRLTLTKKLLRHFVGDDSSKTVASKAIRTMRLDFANLGKIVSRNLFNGRVLELSPIQTFWFNAVERLLSIHLLG